MADKPIRIILDSSGAKRGADSLNDSMRGVGASADKAQFSVGKLAGAISAVIASQKLTQFITDSILATRNFEKAVSELAAITGATGKDLEFLASASREFGATTTLSATQAAEAFKLIASAKPDLLDNVQALRAVTKEAIALSEAAGIDLAQAANSLGNSLNQFNQSADEAGRFINVLAAGAKFGASEIADTSEALKNAGVSARAAGVGFEQANAAIQLLAASGIKGAEAGTGLRNVLTILDTNINQKFRPSVVGLSAALANVNAAQLDATEMTKLFGRENLNSARILLENSERLDDLTRKITGTSTAYEQQQIVTDNLDGDIKRLNSSYQELQLTLGDIFGDSTRNAVQSVNGAILDITKNFETIITVAEYLAVLVGTRLSVAIGASAVAFAAQSAAGLKATVTMNSLGQVTARTTVATNLMAASSRAATGAMALLGGPVGILLIAATSLAFFASKSTEATSSVDLLTRATDKLTDSQKELLKLEVNEAFDAQILIVKDATNKIKFLNDTLTRGTVTSVEGIAATNRELTVQKSRLDDAKIAAEGLIGKLGELNKANEKPNEGSGIIELTGKPKKEKKTKEPIIDDGEREIASAQGVTRSLQAELELRQSIAQIYRENTLAADASLYEQQLAQVRIKEAEELAVAQSKATNEAAQREERLAATLDNDRLTVEARAALRVQFDEQEKLGRQIHQEEITAIEENGKKAREDLARAEFQAKLANVGALGNALISLGQGQSKKIFKVGQTLALAQAAVALPSAVLQSFQNGGGYPFGLIPAGAMLATGIKNIQSIKSAGAGLGGGGGSVNIPSLGGGVGGGSSGQIQSSNVPAFEQKRVIEVRGIDKDSLVTGAQLVDIMQSDDSVIVALSGAQQDAQRRGVI